MSKILAAYQWTVWVLAFVKVFIKCCNEIPIIALSYSNGKFFAKTRGVQKPEIQTLIECFAAARLALFDYNADSQLMYHK